MRRLTSAHGLMRGAYLLLTAHRAGNVDDPARLTSLVELIEALPVPAAVPVHPRTRARLEAASWPGCRPSRGWRMTEPLGYVEFSALLVRRRARC